VNFLVVFNLVNHFKGFIYACTLFLVIDQID